MSDAPAPPFTPGQHVRVTCTGHPRTGDVGVVVTVDWSEGIIPSG